MTRRSDDHVQRPLGGDLDCCRNPVTGVISPWSKGHLENIRPSYTEGSPSGCGLRFFVWGRIPDGTNSITGDGPQDDLSEDDKKEILKVKPDVQKKIDKGGLGFNHLELYAQDRHLSVTGNRLDEYCFQKRIDQKL